MPLSESDLFAEIGRELERDQMQAFPQSVELLRRRGERFFASKLAEVRASICPNKTLRTLAAGGVTIDLAQAVLATLETSTLGTAATPIAVLVCRQGLTSLCNESWSSQEKAK